MQSGDETYDQELDRPVIVVFPPANSPGRLIHDAHARISSELVRLLRDEGYDLSAEQWAVFSLLGHFHDLSQLMIGRLLGKDRHQVSRLVDGLEERGYVVRTPSQKDGRVKLVRLSEAGREAHPRIVRLLTAYLETILQGITQQEYDAFVKCLRHIADRPLPDENSAPAS